MDVPNWFFISTIEIETISEELTRDFHNLCSQLPGIKNHAWRLVSTHPRRYLFFVNSDTPINQETIFDLSILLQTAGNVISETTNCVLPPEVPLYSSVYVIDTGYKVIGRNPTLDEFFSKLDENYKVTYLEGTMTLSFESDNPFKIIKTQKVLENLLHNFDTLKLITSFVNWKR